MKSGVSANQLWTQVRTFQGVDDVDADQRHDCHGCDGLDAR